MMYEPKESEYVIKEMCSSKHLDRFADIFPVFRNFHYMGFDSYSQSVCLDSYVLKAMLGLH